MVVVAALLLPILSVSAVYAQQRSWNDATQDMWAMDMATEDMQADASHRNGDLERVTVTHGLRAITIRMDFAALDRTGSALLFMGEVRTNERVRRGFELLALPGMWAGELAAYKPTGVEVRGVTRTINYDTDVVMVRFPRSVLSYPRWVQVQLFGSHMVMVSEEQGTMWLDDAHSAGIDGTLWSARIYKG